MPPLLARLETEWVEKHIVVLGGGILIVIGLSDSTFHLSRTLPNALAKGVGNRYSLVGGHKSLGGGVEAVNHKSSLPRPR
jgi:hypothetical protein